MLGCIEELAGEEDVHLVSPEVEAARVLIQLLLLLARLHAHLMRALRQLWRGHNITHCWLSQAKGLHCSINCR